MQGDRPTDHELIDLIYASLLGEASWQGFLDRLTQLLPGGKSTLFFHDVNRHAGRFSLVSGFEDAAVARYDGYFSRINPWMPKAAVRPVELGVVADQMLPRADLLRTEFYNDFMRPLGGQSAVGVTIMREEGCSFLLSILTERGEAEANMAAARTLGALAPHLRRAFDHYRRGAIANAQHRVVGSVFETLATGVVIVGTNGTVKSASSIAHRMIESGIGLRITPTGRLRAVDARLSALIDAVTDASPSVPQVADAITSGEAGANATRLTLIRVGRDRFEAYFEGPVVVILLEPALRETAPTAVERLTSMHRLTAAERRVLDGLTEGLTVKEIADRSELSRETIRNQLKSVFAKVGVTRQVDLVRLVAQFSPRFGSS